MKPITVSALLLLLLTLPGCIVGEIKDQLQSANDQLVCVQFALDDANKGLASANDLLVRTNERLDRVENGLTRLDRTNTLIDNVEQGLGRIDSTNNRLSDLERQLALLESIEKSLSRLDQHLASLRKTVSALDGVIPFLDLGGEYVEPSTPAPTDAAIAAADAPQEQQDAATTPQPADGKTSASPTAPADGAAPQTAASQARRDSLMGVWVRAYPDRTVALVIHADNTYERSLPSPGGPAGSTPAGQPMIERGTWKRDAMNVVFTPGPAAPANAPAGGASPAKAAGKSPDQPAGKQPSPSATPWTVHIISLSSKALALEEDGKLTLYARP